jgi:YesN/AraC family two-component response regulator
MSVRVMLVDDHTMMRQGLAALLSGVPDIEVVGEAADGRTALSLLRKRQGIKSVSLSQLIT